MSQKKFQDLRKKINENLTKGFIKSRSFPTKVPISVKKPGRNGNNQISNIPDNIPDGKKQNVCEVSNSDVYKLNSSHIQEG